MMIPRYSGTNKSTIMKYSSTLVALLYVSLALSQNVPDSKKMEMLLKEISTEAIVLGDVNGSLTKEQLDSSWLGFPPTTKDKIILLEQRLGINLPADFVQFLLITNGFRAANSVEPSFCSIDKMDYLKNVDAELYKIWKKGGNSAVVKKMKTAIKVGGYDEEQYFFLIPPGRGNPEWEYWVFAAWAPGETVFESLAMYFESVLKNTKTFIKDQNNATNE